MDANYHAQQTPQFRVLSEAQMRRLYQATLECLERTGVAVHNAEARRLLAGAGARLDGERAYIPPHIIQDAVAANPRSFTLWGRDGVHRMQVIPDRVYFGPGPTCTYFIDPHSGEMHQTRRGDPGLTARVCDALENIDYVMSLGLIGDVPPRLAPVYEFAEMIANSGKPVLAWGYSTENVSDIYQMALAVAGSEQALRHKPNMAFFATYQSPLIQTDEDLANVLWAVEHGLPVIYLGGGCAGTTAPVTAAGTLVISLAGALTGLAILQLKQRGARVCIGSVPQAMDLRTARPPYGGPEMSLYSAALADICRWLGLPFMGTAGASESKLLDLQAAIECSQQALLSALSGAALVHDVGFLDCAQIGSLDALVMNDEIIAMTRRVMRGIEVSDDTLMLDLIDKVGPGGQFISTPETRKRYRQEIWNPTLMDRQPFESWQAAGALDMNQRIHLKLEKILAEHQPPPLPAGAAEKIAAVLQAAEKREAGKKTE
jgi:trimethylamine--corrinoid protein Co-methyltransferase